VRISSSLAEDEEDEVEVVASEDVELRRDGSSSFSCSFPFDGGALAWACGSDVDSCRMRST